MSEIQIFFSENRSIKFYCINLWGYFSSKTLEKRDTENVSDKISIYSETLFTCKICKTARFGTFLELVSSFFATVIQTLVQKRL